VDLLLARLSDQEKKSIARVGVFPTDNHLIRDLLQYKKGTHITESVKANGNTVHEAYIYESQALKDQ
jgi:hypothetical protein